MATINGTSGNDTLTGTSAPDLMDGGDGNDMLQGLEGNDTLLGGGGDDWVLGGAGDDSMEGGSGWDTVDFQTSAGAVSVNMATGVANTAEGNDVFSGFEAVIGSHYNDTIIGNSGDNNLEGRDGNDSIVGGGGFDRALYWLGGSVDANLATGIATGADHGTDTLVGISGLVGSTSRDTLTGNGAGNTFEGYGGGDKIDGGGGTDQVSYLWSQTKVNANLVLGTVSGAKWGSNSGTDTLVGIENLAGSNFNDTLIGDANGNTLAGYGGNDSIFGGAGYDVLYGGSGSDTMDGGIVLDRSGYSDMNRVSYEFDPTAVTVNLSGITGDGSVGKGTATDGWGGIDVLMNVQHIVGSQYADSIVGSSAQIFEQFEGGLGNDTIDGGAITSSANSNRVVYLSAPGSVTVDLAAGLATGSQGTDTLRNINHIRASTHNDSLYGSNRTDFTEAFDGRAGNDFIDGRGGYDVVRYDAATTGVNVNLATGIAQDGQGGTDTLVGIEEIRGTAYNDTLTGGNPQGGVTIDDGLTELFRGNGGNDIIDGGAGFDRVYYDSSTSGVNVTLGGTGVGTAQDGLGGTDTLMNIEAVLGSSYNDTLTGSDSGAFESFEGGAGNDTIDGKGGVDRVDFRRLATSGVKVDLASGKASNDGQGGVDTLLNIEDVRGSAFNDVILGDDQGNKLDGYLGNDSLSGGDGDDTLVAGAGSDTLDGGNGTDLVVLDGALGDYAIARVTQTDTKLTRGTESVLVRNVENFEFSDGAKTLQDLLGSVGTALGDTLVGSANADLLDGLAGNDSISGFDGNDTLIGGAGVDTLIGGLGDDVYEIDVAADVITELADEGTDLVRVKLPSGSYALTANVENAVAYSTGALGLVGNALDNKLEGNAAANKLEGAAGADTLLGGVGNDTLMGGTGDDLMDGGAGNDVYEVDSANDQVIEALNGGTDLVNVVMASGGYSLAENVENATVAATAGAVGLFGNSLVNTLTGNTADNVLDGGAGADRLIGGAGNDTYIVDVAGDAITEAANQGIDTVLVNFSSTGTYTLAANVEVGRVITINPNVQVNLTGNTSANELVGHAGNNLLNGGSGNDTLIGNGGADTLDGGVGTDTVVFSGAYDDYRIARPSATEMRLTDKLTEVVTVVRNVELFKFSGEELPRSLASIISGTPGPEANELHGTEGVDVIDGLAGNDSLYGEGGEDTLIGGLGNDFLDGGSGIDSLVGGAGDDTYLIESSNDVVYEESASGGKDLVLVNTDGGPYTLPDFVENAIAVGGWIDLYGNSLANMLTGNDERNELDGGDGNDTLTGNGGNDTLRGGMGSDKMIGGLGDDTYYVNVTGDVVTEALAQGTDKVVVELAVKGTYTLGANVENGEIASGSVAGTNLTGNALANELTGNELANLLSGGAGNDRLIGGGGNDTLDGGTGAADTLDVAVFSGSRDDYVVASTSATETRLTSIADPTEIVIVKNVDFFEFAGEIMISWNDLRTGVASSGKDTLTGGAGDDLIDGLAGDDNISGLDGNDSLVGGLGNDILLGGDGNDTLNGSGGNDQMTGGLGDDWYAVDATGDTVMEAAGEGTDTVDVYLASGLYTLAANVENSRIMSTGAVSLTGNGLDNMLTGNIAANKLIGLDGNDTLNGGLGKDTLTGGDGADVFVFDKAPNTTTNADTITDFVSGTDKIQLDLDVFAALDDEPNLFGSGKLVYSATGTTAGQLLYDADGSAGSGKGVVIAILGTATVGRPAGLTDADFLIV